MISWKHLDTATVPGSHCRLRLYQFEQDYSIQVDDSELMNSRAYASETGFAELGCARIQGLAKPRVLIGGLGMGYSLKTALDHLPKDAEVIVAELVPQVVAWNQLLLGHLAGYPLKDSRVTLREIDVACALREPNGGYDLVLLDVDNGPAGLVCSANGWIYSRAGLLAARNALRPQGVLGFWSSGPNDIFFRRLQQAGFEVEETSLNAAIGSNNLSHTIWLAKLQALQAAAVR
jgi:spermidine synthase